MYRHLARYPRRHHRLLLERVEARGKEEAFAYGPNWSFLLNGYVHLHLLVPLLVTHWSAQPTVGIGVTALVSKTPYSIKAGKIMLAFLCIGVFSATVGPNACGWIYIGESGSVRLRAKTTTLGALGNGITGVVYNVAIPYMLETNRLGVGGSAI